MKFPVLSAFALLFAVAPSAFADKILAPGEFYTSVNAGEQVVCMGAAAPTPPSTLNFLAEGSTQMSAQEMNDASACTGQMDTSSPAELRAKGISESNGVGIQCPQGYSCAEQNGAMQYRRRGNLCFAYVPFLATRN